jgi:TetR/AcrR family transcriptional regulator, transcriptional repressor for nem operon
MDCQQVLTRAMGMFRRRGYGAVSIKDLERVTGLASGSLYHAYRDKSGLFRAAFAHYNAAVVGCRIEQYLTEAAGLDGVRRLFLSLLPGSGGDTAGCLVTNAAIEFGAGRSIARQGIDEGFHLLREALTRAISRAREAGTLSPSIVPETAVLRLLALYQGILVLVRAGQDTSGMATVITSELEQLQQGGSTSGGAR